MRPALPPPLPLPLLWVLFGRCRVQALCACLPRHTAPLQQLPLHRPPPPPPPPTAHERRQLQPVAVQGLSRPPNIALCRFGRPNTRSRAPEPKPTHTQRCLNSQVCTPTLSSPLLLTYPLVLSSTVLRACEGGRDLWGLIALRQSLAERKKFRATPKKRKYRPIRLDPRPSAGAGAAAGQPAAAVLPPPAAGVKRSSVVDHLPPAFKPAPPVLLDDDTRTLVASHAVRRARERLVRQALEQQPLRELWQTTQQHVRQNRLDREAHYTEVDDVRARLEQHLDNRDWRLSKGMKPLTIDGNHL